MKMTDLETMSTADLVAIYNEHAAADVKRFAKREDAIRRTAEALKAAGKLEGEESPAQVKPQKSAKAGKAHRVAKEPKPAKAVKEPKPAKAVKEPKPAKGAPKKSAPYVAVSEKAKGYNPKGYKPRPTSDRGVLITAIRDAGPAGITREELMLICPQVSLGPALTTLLQDHIIERLLP